MKAEVDPTEEKGVRRLFLPSQGDLCLLFHTQAQELLLCCCPRITHLPPLFFLCPLPIEGEKKVE